MRAHLRLAGGVFLVLAVLAGVLSQAACGERSDESVTSATTVHATASTTTPSAVSTSAPETAPTSVQPSATDPLAFPVDAYTVDTKRFKTPAGEVEITFKLYRDIVYVARPVDPAYQCLNVCVPLKIGGVEVDASEAPILLPIEVAGYWSSKIAGTGGVLGPNASLALASGLVVVSPGCRGSDNVAADGTYFGKAPAAIVDLKSAVRYLHYNDAVMPGDAKRIISVGGSAGGALSALLGVSGDSSSYDSYFRELGAAEASDAIFASACFCPVTDLEHADGAYEWMFGAMPLETGLVDQTLSAELKAAYAEYLLSLGLQGKAGFGTITADNYADYLLQTYLIPAATRYLTTLEENTRAKYLADNPWITWANGTASFIWADYLKHFERTVGRKYGLPAFDSFTRGAVLDLL